MALRLFKKFAHLLCRNLRFSSVFTRPRHCTFTQARWMSWIHTNIHRACKKHFQDYWVIGLCLSSCILINTQSFGNWICFRPQVGEWKTVLRQLQSSGLQPGAYVPAGVRGRHQPASELYRLSDRRLSAKLMSISEDSGCCVVSTTDPYGRSLGFLDRSHYFFFQVAP
jgi:hypothetical protein